MLKFSVLGAGAVALACLAHPASAQKAKDTLRLALDAPIQGISYYLDPKPETVFETEAVFDNLIVFNEKEFKFEPLLAKSWKQVDPLTLEFELRDDIKWHDGEKFDADDVVHTLNWITDPKTTNIRFKGNWEFIAKVEKTGPNTVRVISKQPTPYALTRMAYLTSIEAEHAHGKAEDKIVYSAGKPVGTGIGLNSLYNLQHVIGGEKTMAQILVEGPGGIAVVPGTSGLARMADLSEQGRQNIMAGLRQMQERADFVVIDTMAGIGKSATAFVLAADEVLLVSAPEPSSIVDAYAMLKTIYQKRDDAIVRLIANMVMNKNQASLVYSKLSGAAQQYLGRKLSYLGMVPRDPHVGQAVMQSHPFVLRYPASPAAKSIEDIAERLISQRAVTPGTEGFLRRFAQTLGLGARTA